MQTLPGTHCSALGLAAAMGTAFLSLVVLPSFLPTTAFSPNSHFKKHIFIVIHLGCASGLLWRAAELIGKTHKDAVPLNGVCSEFVMEIVLA